MFEPKLSSHYSSQNGLKMSILLSIQDKEFEIEAKLIFLTQNLCRRQLLLQNKTFSSSVY
jgi:hypothetical protein